jgi:microcin C transport system substrate-binding protein
LAVRQPAGGLGKLSGHQVESGRRAGHAALAANNLDDLEAATRALDRMLINEYYLVPQYYNAEFAHRLQDDAGVSEDRAVTYQAEDWIIDYWYKKPPAGLSAATPVSAPSAAN